MNIDGAAIAVAAAAVGSIVTFGFTTFQEGRRRAWAREDAEAADERAQVRERQRRIEERSEVAAHELLQLFDLLRQRLRPIRGYDYEVPSVDDLTSDIDRLAVQLGNSDVRRRIENLATAFRRVSSIKNMGGDTPSVVAWNLYPIARNALGSVLSGEELGDARVLGEYLAMIEEHDQMAAEQQEEERQRRRTGG